MFALSNLIPNDGTPSFINEVCFHPTGATFAVTYEQCNEVRLYDARTLDVVKVFGNPAATLDKPHALALSQRHLIVANKGKFPCEFRIFRVDDDSGIPVHTFTTPFAHLAEGHSMALHSGRLAVTYCEGRGKKGAIVSYDFDDASGRIVGARDKQERWFRRYGDAKGISFDDTGERAYVTFESDFMEGPRKFVERLKNVVSAGSRGATTRNGIAVFGVDRRGRFTQRPLRKKVFPEFCRLENIHVSGGRAVVTNADGGYVMVYDLQRESVFGAPAQVLRDCFAFPHGAKLSPDGKLLVVTDNGLVNANHRVQWNSFVSPRKDGVVVFKSQPA